MSALFRRPTAVRVPSDMVLTARTLAGIARRLTTLEVAALIERLISDLDGRDRDCDYEGAPELCAA